jgi:hypothetical protein
VSPDSNSGPCRRQTEPARAPRAADSCQTVPARCGLVSTGASGPARPVAGPHGPAVTVVGVTRIAAAARPVNLKVYGIMILVRIEGCHSISAALPV